MRRSRWVPAALWAAFIELLTSWPRVQTFGAPEGGDKVAHVLLFGILAFLVMRAAQPGRPTPRAMAIALVALVLWAALDEWHQKFILGRYADFSDWIADSVGVALGLGFRWIKSPRLSAGSPA